MYMSIADFKRSRKQAYSVIDTARLMNYSPLSLQIAKNNGMIPAPTPRTKRGAEARGQHAYYKEDDFYEIRDALAGVHTGRPRSDGLIINT